MNNKKLFAGFVVFSLGASQVLAQVAAPAVLRLDPANFQFDGNGELKLPVIEAKYGGGGGFGGGRSSSSESSFHSYSSHSESTYSAPKTYSAPRTYEAPRASETRAPEARTPEVTTGRITEKGKEITETSRPNSFSKDKFNPNTGVNTRTTTRINPRTGEPAVTRTKTDVLTGNRITEHSNGAVTVKHTDGTTVHTSPTGRVTTVKVTDYGSTRIVVRNNVTYNYGRGYGHYNYYYYNPSWFAFDAFVFAAALSNPYYNSWGWNANPWYNYYPGYLTPYGYYPQPSYWVTDAYLAALLADRYADEANAQEQQGQLAPLDPQVKDQIRAQVDEEMNNYQKHQPLTLDSTLKLNRIFTVSEDFTAKDANDNDVNLASGDLIKLVALPEEDGGPATMEVVSSESADAGAQFPMSLENIQKMNDKFAQDTEAAMKQMQAAKASGQLK